MGETLTETAGLEKVAQRLAFRVRRVEQCRRLPIEAHDLAQQGEVRRPAPGSAAARRTRWRRGCCTRARSAGTTPRTTCPSRGWPRRARRTAARGSDTCGRCAPGSRYRAPRRRWRRRPPPCWYGRPVVDSFSNRWTRWRRLKKCAAAKPEMPAPITATVFIDVQEYQYRRSVVKHLSMTNQLTTSPAPRYADGARDARESGISMGHTIKLAAVGAVAFMVLDGVWLGLLMKNFYRGQLAPIVRLADGGIAPNWPAAFVVYVLLGAGIALFVIPRASTVSLRGRVRRPVRAGRVWRLRFHQLLDAAPVAVRADARRRGMGSAGIRRCGDGRADRGSMSATTRRPGALSDPRRLQADRDRHRHAACLGAALRRRHADP